MNDDWERLEKAWLEPPDDSDYDVMNTDCEECNEAFDIMVTKLDELIDDGQAVLCPDCIERLSYLVRK